MDSKMSVKTILSIGGSFAAYHIGAGFASGQEALQYFGSWGGIYPILLPAVLFVAVIVFNLSNYRVGMEELDASPHEVFNYYCGKKAGPLINIFTNIVVGLTTIVMFAGCGATVNQYLGVPVWVGAVAIGVISAIVVCFGLESVVNVLGSLGVIIIAIMAIAGLYTFFTTDTNIFEGESNILEYVAEGKVLQATAFGTHNPILTTISFAGLALSLIIVFNVSLGQRCKNRKEVIGGGDLCGGILYNRPSYGAIHYAAQS